MIHIKKNGYIWSFFIIICLFLFFKWSALNANYFYTKNFQNSNIDYGLFLSSLVSAISPYFHYIPVSHHVHHFAL